MKKIIVTFVLLSYILTSCGTIFYPERRGNKSKIDGTTAILDAIGLLFFIIPGVIAFAVDFSTGCIYLSGGGSKTAYNEKIMLDKNKDMMAQVKNILATRYHTSLDKAVMVSAK